MQAHDWQARAIAAYRQRRSDADAALRRGFAAHVRALTGRTIDEAAIWVDRAERAATALVDGVRFRYEAGQLALLRPCELCGSGSFASPPLNSPEDLGYALSAWQPRHPQCQPDDPTNWLEAGDV